MDDILDKIEVTIERILPKGVGIGHADGRTFFVPLTAPGDTVRVRTRSVKGSLVFAELVDVVTAGDDRVVPRCDYFGECGGCDLQQLAYDAQLRAKLAIIRDCFHRIGKFDYPEPEIIANSQQFGYRTRSRIHLERSSGNVGFYRRDSNEVVDIERCIVLDDEVQDALSTIRAKKEDLLRQGRSEIELSLTDNGVITSDNDAMLDRSGQNAIGEFVYRFSAGSFFQGSRAMLPTLVATAIDGIYDMDCLDLYSGVGLFSLPLARANRSVIAVESNREAAAFARENLIENGLSNAEVVCDKVFRYLRNARPNVTAVVVDPPRIGLERGVAESIIALEPAVVSYVSCEPATLARDAGIFIKSGYRIEKVTAIDLFPQTHHIETVVRLVRT